MNENYGYDYEPKTGKYRRLKDDAPELRLRLVGGPKQFVKVWDGDGGTRVVQRFAWRALVKEKVSGKWTSTECVGFDAPVTVYNAVKKLAQDPDWGNPNGYDLTFTCSGSGVNRKYAVTPSPAKSPLTADEKRLIEEADIDLEAMYQGDQPVNGSAPVAHQPQKVQGHASPSASADEYDPFSEDD